jgi:hypothetical protein
MKVYERVEICILELSDLHLYLTSSFVVVVVVVVVVAAVAAAAVVVVVVVFGPSKSYKFLVIALLLIARCHGGILPRSFC